MSKYKIGWIGLRVERIGSAAKILKRSGWIKLHHAHRNNRNAFDWIKPGVKEEDFDGLHWRDVMTRSGIRGVGFWITDAQHEWSKSITDRQWQNSVQF